MSGRRAGTGEDDLRRYLARRASLAGGIVYLAGERGVEAPGRAGASEAAEGAEPPKKPEAAAGKNAPAEKVVVRTSPAGSVDGAGKGRMKKTGIARNTGRAVQDGLFEGPARAGPDLSGLDMEALEETVSGCDLCALGSERNRTVFGDGDPGAGIVFVGEAPGKEEDLQGLPFVGRAGKLLDKILEAMDLSRSEVYIANILKCRPPGNRDPNEEEVACCEGYLARQLELIDPVLICALGRVAGQNLLGTRAPLKELRGSLHRYNGIPVLVTYHPAALLRNPHLKRDAWEDMKELRRLYDELR